MTGGIQVDGEAMKQVVAKAILEGLGDDQRDLIIQAAVEQLLKKPVDNWGRSTGDSPIQTAFDQAVNTAVRVVAREMVDENADLQAKIRSLMSQVIEDVLTGDDSGLPAAVRAAVGSAISEFQQRSY